jgi:hypothetical protein
LLARHVNVAPRHLRAVREHRAAVTVTVTVAVTAVFVLVWIVCVIVLASYVDRGDRFDLVLLRCSLQPSSSSPLLGLIRSPSSSSSLVLVLVLVLLR